MTAVFGECEEARSFSSPDHALTVGTLQNFIDRYTAAHPGVKCDYIHDEASLRTLAAADGAVGFLLDGMAKEELFKVPIFGSIIRNLHAFPVRRGASDKTAIKKALGILKSGDCMAIFPEGTRSKDGKLGKVGAGVSLLASMSKATVVPVAIVGTRNIFGKKFLPKVAVLYGEPMKFDAEHADKQALNDFSAELMKRIQAMLDAHERGEVI